MFKRPHHQRIEKVLQSLDGELLLQYQCFFGGGTAIALQLEEFRESIDIDFLCASSEGYKALINTVSNVQLGKLEKQPLKHLRDIRFDRYGVRTFVEVDGTPIKLEFVREDRIHISGHKITGLPVPIPVS